MVEKSHAVDSCWQSGRQDKTGLAVHARGKSPSWDRATHQAGEIKQWTLEDAPHVCWCLSGRKGHVKSESVPWFPGASQFISLLYRPFFPRLEPRPITVNHVSYHDSRFTTTSAADRTRGRPPCSRDGPSLDHCSANLTRTHPSSVLEGSGCGSLPAAKKSL